MFHAAIKAQGCNPGCVPLLKQAELHLLLCPSADRAVLFGFPNLSERRLPEPQDQTEDGNHEETENEELHRSTSLIARKILYSPTVLFFFLSSNPAFFAYPAQQSEPIVMRTSHRYQTVLHTIIRPEEAILCE